MSDYRNISNTKKFRLQIYQIQRNLDYRCINYDVYIIKYMY